jgi:glycosyltransferase involved in cell wall biosynthesis
MKYLAYISLAILSIEFINVVINLFFRQKIKVHKKDKNDSTPKISILIPARNEEKNISDLLKDLHKIKEKNIEIIVYDDESTDNTANIVLYFANKDDRISLLSSNGLPSNWLGKNYACYQLAQKAKGDYLLFLDADIRIDGELIFDAVSYMKLHNLKLLTIFPIQHTETFGEKISVPVMNYILLTLLPLIFVRVSPFSAHSAANGQFMLFEAQKYRELSPHLNFRNSPVEDIAIARFYKKNKQKIACITGDERVKCRMYNSYSDAKQGFVKNVLMFFGNSPLLAILFWAHSSFGFIPVLMTSTNLLMLYILLMISIIIIYSLISKQNFLVNLLLYPFQMFFLITTILNALIWRKGKKVVWKERVISY